MIKKITLAIVTSALILTGASATLAAPFNAADKNPNVVAYYADGRHAIVGVGDQFFGKDLVLQRGQSGNFQQWFYGIFPDGTKGGIHSVWNVSKTGTCASGWILVKNAYPQWGSYIQPNTDFCVHNNYFHVSK
jgi:hypothetical protein